MSLLFLLSRFLIGGKKLDSSFSNTKIDSIPRRQLHEEWSTFNTFKEPQDYASMSLETGRKME